MILLLKFIIVLVKFVISSVNLHLSVYKLNHSLYRLVRWHSKVLWCRVIASNQPLQSFVEHGLRSRRVFHEVKD